MLALLVYRYGTQVKHKLDTYNWLSCDLLEVFDVVVLMLLKCSKQHLHHLVFVITSLLAFSLLSLLSFNLKKKKNEIDTFTQFTI